MSDYLITTSWDDGAKEDLRLAELLSKYDIPATFYVPISNPEHAMLERKEIKELSRINNIEIGGHTQDHVDLTKLSLNDAVKEIYEGKKEIENIIGHEITSFAYPKGKMNQEIKQAVGLSGFDYARGVSLFEVSVFDRLNAGTTVHAYDHHPLVLGKELVRSGIVRRLPRLGNIKNGWDQLAREYLDYVVQKGGMFHLWGHSWEIAENNHWKRLESVLSYIRKNTKRSFRVTNSELIKKLSDKKKKYYENLDPEIYDTSQKSLHRDDLEVLYPLVKKHDKKDKQILEVGCGTGRFAKLFREAKYTGIDYDTSFIEFAREHWENRDRKFVQGDMNNQGDMNLRKYDLIIIWGLFEDDPNPYQRISDMLEDDLLKQSGEIIFTLHNQGDARFVLPRMFRKVMDCEPFPYTSFTRDFLAEEGSIRARKMEFKQLIFKKRGVLYVHLKKN